MNTTAAKIVLFAIKTKKGLPIRLRYYVDGKAKYVNLGYYLSEGEKKRYWNEKTKELRTFYPFYDEVNAEFEKQKIKLQINTPSNSKSFTDYFQNFIDTLTTTKQYGLKQKCSSTLKHLKNHAGGEVLFSDLNLTYLNSLKLYFTKNNVAPVTQKGYLEKIRKQINDAIAEDVYAPTKHPFIGFQFNKVITTPREKALIVSCQILMNHLT